MSRQALMHDVATWMASKSWCSEMHRTHRIRHSNVTALILMIVSACGDESGGIILKSLRKRIVEFLVAAAGETDEGDIPMVDDKSMHVLMLPQVLSHFTQFHCSDDDIDTLLRHTVPISHRTYNSKPKAIATPMPDSAPARDTSIRGVLSGRVAAFIGQASD